MSKSKIVIIRNAQPYDFGGGERFPVFLAEALGSEGLKPVIVSRSEKLLEFAKKQGVSSVKGWWWSRQNWSGVNNLLIPIYIVWQLLLLGYYLYVFWRLRPGVVHIQSKDDFIAATLAGRLSNASIVWTDHADLKHIWRNVSQPLRNPIGKLVLLVSRLVSAITVVSKSERGLIAEQLAESEPTLDKITVVHNGSSDRLTDTASSNSNQNGLFTYIVASRLVVDKGIGEAIAAFREVHAEHDNTRLLIIGDGPDRPRFESLSGSDGSIAYVGHMSDPFGSILSGDVFLQPTYHEGFSVVLVEACMLGMPIIATNVGGNPEIIRDGDNGLLVPAKDSSALAKAMLRLYRDEELRQRLATEARKTYLEGFVFEDIVRDQFMPIYERANYANKS